MGYIQPGDIVASYNKTGRVKENERPKPPEEVIKKVLERNIKLKAERKHVRLMPKYNNKTKQPQTIEHPICPNNLAKSQPPVNQ